MSGPIARYRAWRADRRYVSDVEEAHAVNRMIDDLARIRALDIAERGAAGVRAREARRGDRRSKHWRPEDVEVACEVFFGDDWWDNRQVFSLRSTYRTDMTDALNAAMVSRHAGLTIERDPASEEAPDATAR